MSLSRIRLQCKNTDTETNWIIVVCSWGSFDASCLSTAKAQSLGKKFEFCFCVVFCQNVAVVPPTSKILGVKGGRIVTCNFLVKTDWDTSITKLLGDKISRNCNVLNSQKSKESKVGFAWFLLNFSWIDHQPMQCQNFLLIETSAIFELLCFAVGSLSSNIWPTIGWRKSL